MSRSNNNQKRGDQKRSSYYPQVEIMVESEWGRRSSKATLFPQLTTYFTNQPTRPTIPSLSQIIITKESIDSIHQPILSILYTPIVIMDLLSSIRVSIQETHAGSQGASSRRSFQQSSSSLSHAEDITGPLQVERTRGIGRSRSMIVEVSVQGRKSSPRRRRGSLTFAVSINALPRAGSSRRRSESPADSTPHVPRRSTRRASMF